MNKNTCTWNSFFDIIKIENSSTVLNLWRVFYEKNLIPHAYRITGVGLPVFFRLY